MSSAFTGSVGVETGVSETLHLLLTAHGLSTKKSLSSTVPPAELWVLTLNRIQLLVNPAGATGPSRKHFWWDFGRIHLKHGSFHPLILKSKWNLPSMSALSCTCLPLWVDKKLSYKLFTREKSNIHHSWWTLVLSQTLILWDTRMTNGQTASGLSILRVFNQVRMKSEPEPRVCVLLWMLCVPCWSRRPLRPPGQREAPWRHWR